MKLSGSTSNAKEPLACPTCHRPYKQPSSSHSRIIVWGSVFLVLFLVYFLMNVKLF